MGGPCTKLITGSVKFARPQEASGRKPKPLSVNEIAELELNPDAWPKFENFVKAAKRSASNGSHRNEKKAKSTRSR
jgi:hypothetical protein